MAEILRRTIIGAADRDREALVRIVVPAGGEVELKPHWEFLGWEDEPASRIREGLIGYLLTPVNESKRAALQPAGEDPG